LIVPVGALSKEDVSLFVGNAQSFTDITSPSCDKGAPSIDKPLL
jgi:hypothetical protein